MLKECDFALMYSTGYNHEPKEFFTEALIESKSFDLGLGFFSSSGIRCLAYGFAIFIANGGKMRIVINHILSEQDKTAINNGQNGNFDDFEEKILNNIEQLCNTLSREDKQFFRCLSYLIAHKRIEFVATISTQGGLGHDKYGVFTDESGNKVAFAGSANFSHTAMELNGESIQAFTSWKDKDRVTELESIFESTWKGDTPHLKHIPLNKVTTFVRNKFGEMELHGLIEEEINLHDDLKEYNAEKTIMSKPLSDRLLQKIKLKEQEPRFPYPEKRHIQVEAYQAWRDNNKQGIFAMATGSGKTVTALNCLLEESKQNRTYKAIIVVPTQALALQWEDAAKGFNFQDVLSTHTNKEWKKDLSRYTTKCLLNSNRNLILITTYATFIRKTVQEFVSKTKGIENFVFIADEAHNLGSRGPLKHLPTKIKYRIGLSATPERAYDEVGSRKLYEFFNSMPPKYTFCFTMKQAIEEGILCRYNYHPIFVPLTYTELEEYTRITEHLRRFIDAETGKYKKDAEMLLMKRKRIIHKAQNKKIEVSRLLKTLSKEKELKYTFVFVPEGYEPDYADVDDYRIDDNDIHIYYCPLNANAQCPTS